MSGSSAYVIAGAGLAGAKAAETLRSEGFDGPVVLIGDEAAQMHRGAGDYEPQERRIMLRTIVYPN